MIRSYMDDILYVFAIVIDNQSAPQSEFRLRLLPRHTATISSWYFALFEVTIFFLYVVSSRINIAP
mgnify:CR=1 FL=1